MNITFNADEIFEMAEEIERNGAKFYKLAAARFDDEQLRKMLLEMSDMEQGHLEKFKKMRTQLAQEDTKPTVYDPQDEAAMYLQVMADAHGYEGRISPTQELSGNESIKEVIEIALNSEKESVVFYFGIKNMVPSESGKQMIEKIILEELSHITTLLNMLMIIEKGA